MVSLAFVNTFQDHLLAHVSCTATCYQHSQSGGWRNCTLGCSAAGSVLMLICRFFTQTTFSFKYKRYLTIIRKSTQLIFWLHTIFCFSHSWGDGVTLPFWDFQQQLCAHISCTATRWRCSQMVGEILPWAAVSSVLFTGFVTFAFCCP